MPCLVFFLGGGPKLNQSTRNQAVLLLKSLSAITDIVIEDTHTYIHIYIFQTYLPNAQNRLGHGLPTPVAQRQ